MPHEVNHPVQRGMVHEVYSRKLVAPPDFDGPIRDRKCTDVLFAVALVALWVCMTWVGSDSIAEGDIDRLLAPSDYNGNLCGYTAGYEDLPQLYYADFEGSGVCVDGCPDSTDLSTLYVCRDEAEDDPAIAALTDTEKVLNGYCMYQYEAISVVNYCVITNSDVWAQFTSSDAASYLGEFYADMITAREYIFGFGFCMAVILSFVYMGLMRVPGVVATVVWTSIVLVLAGLLGLGYALWTTGEEWDAGDAKDDYQVTAAYALGVVSWVLAFLWLCLMCFMRSSISVAIEVIKEAGHAIIAMPLIMLWPVLQLVGLILFMVVWAYYAAYTASLGELTTKSFDNPLGITLSYQVYEYSQEVEYRGWFLLLCLFWSLGFIVAIGQIVVAMAVSVWYFHRRQAPVGSFTVFSSIAKTFTFHTGTAAFGSLIIAIIKMIRAVLSFVEKKAKDSHNTVLQYVACCCSCCFWCLENCMRFINTNAYIQTAIFSTSFCTSARKAFGLVFRNLGRIGAVSVLSEFIIIIMQVFVMVVTGALSYWIIKDELNTELYSVVGPVVMVMILAYFTAAMFGEVYGMAVETILHCFIADEEMFRPGERHSEESLKGWVDKNGGGTIRAPLHSTTI